MSDKLWFSPDSIKFQKEQVRFLLKYYFTIKNGDWPDPKGAYSTEDERYIEFIQGRELISGRDIIVANSEGLHSSPPVDSLGFYREEILSIFHELESRLNRCSDKELLINRYARDIRIEKLCRMFGLTRQYVYHKCRVALKYLSGQPKKINYKIWLQNR